MFAVALALTDPFRIQICGSLAIEQDGERYESRLPGRQGRLLFTYLVVNRHRQVSRDELAEALWREPDPPRPTPGSTRRWPSCAAFSASAPLTAASPSSCTCLTPGSTSKLPSKPFTAPSPLPPSTSGYEPGDPSWSPCLSPSATSSPARTPRGSTRSVTS